GLTASKVIENWAVLLKIIIIVLFIVVGFFYIKKVNYSPFYPVEFQKGFAGLGGIWASTASVFFAFVGFDTLAANSAETINPGKNMFRGIIGTVLISAILYTLFSLVLTGMVNYTELGVDDPAAFAFSKMGNTFALITGTIITIGALIGMFTAIMSMMFASSRLVYSIGRDGLLPKQLKSINNNTGVPKNALMLTLIIEAVFAGLVPLNELAALINGGTLLAFSVMGVGIFVLRHRKDLKNTGFKMPLYPILPAFSVLATTFFLFELPNKTKIWLLIWLSLGIIVYFAYGFKHSNINKK
ncbi:MAG: amino acid permease, partial [Lactobacillaceae bacterium]|nr:amino acid permease [Lactobacillaceae bacterium]